MPARARIGGKIGAAAAASVTFWVIATIWAAALPGLGWSSRVALAVLGVAATLAPLVANAAAGVKFGLTTLAGVVLPIGGFGLAAVLVENAGIGFQEQLPLTVSINVGLGLGVAIAVAGRSRRQT